MTSTAEFKKKERKARAARLRRGKVKIPRNEWLRLRYQAFKLYGNKCQCCGVGPDKAVLHVDHIKPRSLFPELAKSLSNLQILCEACNLGKSNIDFTDWRTNDKADAEHIAYLKEHGLW